MTHKTKAEENIEARELLFNMFAVNNFMNYIDEETDDLVENVAIDTVDLFELYATLYAFKAYDSKNHGSFIPDEDME